MNIDIQKASREEKYLLRNLMELCQHDYSEFNPEDVNEHGLFGYTYLDHYWTEPERHPFLVRVDSKVAGFVFVRRLDEVPTHTIAEFFILRKYRRRGIGQIVAYHIFDLFPGKWNVRQETGNLPAQAFWKKAIAHYTNNAYQEEETEQGPVQEFYTPDSEAHRLAH